MIKYRLLFLSLIIISTAFFVASCATSLIPTISSEHIKYANERWGNINSSDLIAAREKYIQTCSGCHSLPLITDHDEKKWTELINDMTKEINLPDADKEIIQKYVFTILNTYDKSK